MVYNDRPDPELNGHFLKDINEDAPLIFWVFGIATLIGLGIIYFVVP